MIYHNHERAVAATPGPVTNMCSARRARGRVKRMSNFDHNVVTFDRDRESFGDIGAFNEVRSRCDGDVIVARLEGLGIAPGFAAAEIELPAMPGAAQHRAILRQPVIARPGG